jgi:Zn-dependent protease with chaperone function
MHCPQCSASTLRPENTNRNVLVDVCPACHGVWLDRGKILAFSEQPRVLEQQLSHGLRDRAASRHQCPRCDGGLERGKMPDREAFVEECPQCGGFWFDAQELQRAMQSRPGLKQQPPAPADEPPPEADEQARAAAHERLRDLSMGLLALPNLFLRSVFTLGILYGLLGLLLISLVMFGYLDGTVALVLGIAIAAVQFLVGPWIMDLSLRWVYAFDWVEPDQLPPHLRSFIERVCAENKMKFPHVGLIHDGAPTAFTYGHHPSNARVVISQGILDLLEPAEAEAVVAHELGHARNWDMALMTLANLVPLLLFYIYYLGIRLGGRGRDYAVLVALGAYVLYIVSEYLVLWFSRTREYYADRFAGQATGNPNALASALVKIAYGLAAQGSKDGKEGAEKRERVAALRTLNIFDQTAAVGLVMASSVGRGTDPRHPDVEQIKSAMQWDLWNPWAKFYELHSTHPLVAKRLLYLTDQAAHLGQEPLVVFDRRQPESYWDDFFVDLFMMFLPWLGLLIGAGAAAALWHPVWSSVCLALGVSLAGVGSLLKTNFVYRRDFFPHLSVAALLHKVKVSAVRPVPATLTGTIIGKGVPGLVWSKDFVLQDQTGIIFTDYQQPLAIWNFLFGLLRAGQYQGKQVRVSGWFRRAPVPYLEINQVEVIDGSLPSRRCYSLYARLAVGAVLIAVGVALAALALAAGM